MAAGIAIVEIEIADHCGVDERRSFRRHELAEAQYAACVFAGCLSVGEPPADLRRIAIVRADRAPKRIDQPLAGRMNGFRGQVGKS
jgi:hypothetical protein